MKHQNCESLYRQACKVLVGGVNSPVRAFKAVGGTPLFIKRAKGSKIQDEDGNTYIDFVCSWGALILGSAYPKVVNELRNYLPRGTSYGAPTKLETELAELIISAMPSIEKIRFVNSGTEAGMSVLRVARAYTKRQRILKFEGCYHGHADALLVKGGSGMATFAIPDSDGVTAASTGNTCVATYNDIESVKKTFEKYGDDLAAVIVEPVAANMGLIPPNPRFLAGLREITKTYGSLLIFDEVITGFRASYGGAQKLYEITPDLTCLGKIIGGGLPVGAYGGRQDIMDLVAPLGHVYQAGTLSGNPMAMIAGRITLREIRKPGFYEKLEEKSALLQKGLLEAAQTNQYSVRINRVGSMIGVFFTDKNVVDYETAKSSNVKDYGIFFHSMLAHGAYLPPSAFETIFVSGAHSKNDIAKTVKAAEAAFRATKSHAVAS
ncbi:MAG TPA: glutamate-1-semialdehyde 2,1-aminomutase [Candidatus Bathyarchaeia archaeon]|nr:glutamate-1-semialdehyde 2,1-aminomutase [Candidatus Bathyarchaeia archaeon]